MSLKTREIDVTFQLGTGSFGEGGYDTIKISGHRVAATIVKAGGLSMGESQISIYGMRKQDMDRLSTLGLIPLQMPDQRRNSIIIEASNEQGTMTTVFGGTIANAYFNAQAAPEVTFAVLAYAGLFQALRPTTPTSIKAPVNVATVMQQLAKLSGLDFENSGVNVILPTIYLKSTVREQIRALADQANINWLIDVNKLSIWPRPGKRNIPKATISPQSGMVGYPTFDVQGINVVSIFNPSLQFGAEVTIENSIVGSPKAGVGSANGTWYIYTLYYDLESQLPNGKWFTRFLASPPGYVAVTR